MKYTLVALTALASALIPGAAAADIPSIGECQALVDLVLPCAVEPINDAIVAVGCTRGDYTCACPKYAELLGLAFDGVVAGCGGALQGLPAAEQAQNACNCILALPPPVAGTTTTTAAAPTGTAPPSECQDLIDQVLPCAVDPINDAIEAIGCTRGDYLCACPKYDELLGLAFDGVVAGCGGALEGLPAAEQAQNVCKCLLPAGGTSSSSSSSSVITTTATATDTNTATATDTNTTTATAQPSSCTTVLPPTTPEDNSCAAQIAAVPECAKKCIDDASVKNGCSATDFRCSCVPATQSAITADAFNCVLAACGSGGLGAVVGATTDVCDCLAVNPAPEPIPGSTVTGDCNTATGTSSATSTDNGTPGGGSGTTTAGTGSATGTTTAAPSQCTEVIPGESAGPDSACDAKIALVSACAKPAIEASLVKFGCPAGDYRCACVDETFAKIQGDVVLDVISACGGAVEGAAVIPLVTDVCTCYKSNPAPVAKPGTTLTGECNTTGGVKPTGGAGNGGTITSTTTSTGTSTITQCPETVTKCPLGGVVTVTHTYTTTYCPASSDRPAIPTWTSCHTEGTETITETWCPATETSKPTGGHGGVPGTLVPSKTQGSPAGPTESGPAQFTGAAGRVEVGVVGAAMAVLAGLAL